MTDKKLTDNEIKKALKEILEIMLCEGDLQRSATISNALDLINCIQAENERLKKENIALNRRAIPSSGTILKVGNALLFAENERDYNTTINHIKAEAYKEIKERLEPLKQFRCCMLGNEYELSVTMREIDNLLKEMVGE